VDGKYSEVELPKCVADFLQELAAIQVVAKINIK
jgi:hypothetical protein